MDRISQQFELGDWRVDAAGNRLLRGDEVRPLRHKAMALLVLLARHAGETVSRETIVDAIWEGNHFVAPKAINNAVWTIRQALGDNQDAPRYLETIPKKGYRLIATVRCVAPTDASGPPPAEPAPSRRPPRALAWTAALLTALGVAVVGYTLQRPKAPLAGAATPLPSATPLTQNPGIEYLGRLSPDGRQLAFAWWQGRGDGQLYLRAAADLAAAPSQISADTGDVQGLAWSPDGQSIAYIAAAAGGRCGLWLYRLRDGQRRELAACTALFTPTVDWSPDGRWIAFSATAEGAGGLFLIGADGSGLRRLSTAPPAAMPDHQPAWSPDSQRLAFARQDPADGTRDLYEVTLDGRVQRLSTLRLHLLHGLTFDADGQNLTFSTTRQDARVLLRWDRSVGGAIPLGLEGSAPARSADGRLVYALLRSHVGLSRLSWAAPTPVRLITSVASDRAPDIAAGSQRVAYVSRRTGNAELWQADAQGGNSIALTQLAGQVAAPTWSKDGRQLAFLGNCGPGHRYGLCLLQLDGRQLRPLAADAAQYGRPAWHPTAPEVWVASDRGGRWQLWRFGLDGSAQAVPTERAPGDALAWAADGQGLIYQPRFADELRWRLAVGGAERRIEIAPTGDAKAAAETLVHWRLGPPGLVLLLRGTTEQFRRIDPLSGRQETLSKHALGSFPERARFALFGDDAVLVEVSNAAVADLMQAR